MEKCIYLGINIIGIDFTCLKFHIDRQIYSQSNFSKKLTSYGNVRLLSSFDPVVYAGNCLFTLYSNNAPQILLKDVKIQGIKRHLLYTRGSDMASNNIHLSLSLKLFPELARMIMAYNINLSGGEFNYSIRDVVNNFDSIREGLAHGK